MRREKLLKSQHTISNLANYLFRKMILYVHKLLVKIVQVRSSLLFIAYADQHLMCSLLYIVTRQFLGGVLAKSSPGVGLIGLKGR